MGKNNKKSLNGKKYYKGRFSTDQSEENTKLLGEPIVEQDQSEETTTALMGKPIVVQNQSEENKGNLLGEPLVKQNQSEEENATLSGEPAFKQSDPVQVVWTQELKEVKSNLAAAEEQIDALQQQMPETERQIKEKDAMLHMVSEERENLTRELKEVKSNLAAAEEQIDALQQQMPETERKIKDKDSMLHMVSEEREDLTRELEKSKSNMAAAEEIIDALQQQLLETERQIEENDAKLHMVSEVADEVVVQWYWSGDHGEDHAFNMEVSPEIERFYQKFGTDGTVNIRSGAYTYEIDFSDMTQTNVKTRKKRSISRRSFAADNTDPVQLIRLVLCARLQAVEATRAELQEAQASVHELTSKMEDNEFKISTLAKANLEYKMQLEEKQRWSTCLADKLASAQAEIDTQKGHLASAEAEVARQKALFASGKVEYDKQKIMLQQMRKTEEEAKKTIQDLEKKNKQDHDKCERIVKESKEEAASCEWAKLCKLLEYWKAPASPKVLKIEAPQSVREKVEHVFKDLSHKDPLFNGMQSNCYAFQKLKVKSVHMVSNSFLWSKYMTHKDDLRRIHQSRGINVRPMAPRVNGLELLLDNATFDKDLNEVLLAHGCSSKAAASILEDGFDIRFTNQHGSLYGEGTYFASQMCKCNQYTESAPLRYIIIARVALGDPAYLDNQYTGRLPCWRDRAQEHLGRFDSHIVNPTVSRRGQAHWEYVTFTGCQAYPEMLITYEI